MARPGTVSARTRGGRLRASLAPVVGYCLLAAAGFHPLLARLRTSILADDAFIRPGQSDAYNFLWTYWWDQKAILAGKSPLSCDWVLPPTGADLRWHTHVLLPALLTLPARALLGTVGGYNVMVLALLVGGAVVVERLLRGPFGRSPLASFVGGALFGFAPYFVFKAHAHLNLVGEVFWGAALAALLGAYVTGDFGVRRGVGFALALWATFWTSFVEFTMLAVVAAVTVLVFEAGALASGERPAPGRRLRFLAPSLVGAVSLLPFLARGDAAIVRVPVILPLSVADLFRPPRLSMLTGLGSGDTFEFWGTSLPLVLLIPALYGAVLAVRAKAPGARRLVAMALACLGLTVNVLGVPAALVRALPMGEGFRIFGRFFPFLLFFLAIFAALGVDGLVARVRSLQARLALGLLFVAAAALELAPANLAPSPVRGLPLAADVRRALDPSRRLLVVPRGEHLNVLDTYQVDLDLPAVDLSYLAREDPRTTEERVERYPHVYGAAPLALDDPELLRELADLGVGYVLFEEPPRMDGFPPGHALAVLHPEILWALDPTPRGRGAVRP